MSKIDIKEVVDDFLENYLNNASPTGHEAEGQKFGWTT